MNIANNFQQMSEITKINQLENEIKNKSVYCHQLKDKLLEMSLKVLYTLKTS